MVVGDQDDVNGGKIQQFSLQSKYTGMCLFSLREDKLLCNGSESCKSTAIATSRFMWRNGGGGGGVPQEGRTLAVNPQTLFLHILLAPGKRKTVVRFSFKSPLPQKLKYWYI